MPPGTRPPRREIAIQLVWLVTIALSYYAAGRFGLSFAHYQDNATLVWPPTGLALATLILRGLRAWPGIFLGNLLLNMTPGGLGGWAGLGISTGNTLEAVLGAFLLTRVIDFRPTLERVRDVAALLTLGALVCTTVSATFGVVSLALSGNLAESDPAVVWLIWWLGDVGGAIILTPVILVAADGTPSWRVLLRNGEFWIVMALILALAALSIIGGAEKPWSRVLIFAPFPLVVWAGSRLGSRGAVAASFSIMFIATLAAMQGVAPILVDDPDGRTLVLWSYGITIGMTAMTLAAAIGQRDSAYQQYRAEETERLRVEREHLLMHERARMTREMHDGLGGQLVSTIAMLESGRGSRPELIEGLRRALDDMRIAIDSLDPETTDFSTSLGKLRARLEPLLRRNGIQLHWNIVDSPELDRFLPEESLHLLRIIQEAVTNAVRHAGASELRVSVSSEEGAGGALLVEVRDDGCGWSHPAGHSSGRGVRNMRTRAEALGAKLKIESGASGTSVLVRVPMPPLSPRDPP